MANWNHTNEQPDKELHSIGAMFETGRIKRMYDISNLYPTKIVKLLGINGERYIVKLSEPERFSMSEILRLSFLINVNPNLILEVIQNETEKRIRKKIADQRSKLK